MTDEARTEATARVERRVAQVAAAKERFSQLESRQRAVLSYRVQSANDEARQIVQHRSELGR